MNVALALRILRRLLLLLAGVLLLLHAIFDSGALGDPARRSLGEHATPASLGEWRLQMGWYAAFEPRAARLRLQGGDRLLRLGGQDGSLVLEAVAPEASGPRLAAWSREELQTRELGSWLRDLQAALPEGSGGLQAEARRPELPAAGVLDALSEVPLVLDPRRPAQDLPWAESVSSWRRALRQSWALLRFDLGTSLRSGRPVAAEIGERLGPTLALGLPAFLATSLLALLLGTWSLLRPGGPADRALGLVSAAGLSLSAVTVALLLQRLLGVRWNLLPVHGWEEPRLGSLLLPWISWLAIALGPEFRLARGLLARAWQEPSILAARARGAGRGRTFLRHALPLAAAPLLARLFLGLPFVFLGSLLLESLFGIPGLGAWAVQAVQDGDHAALRSLVFLFTLVWILCQTLADLLGARLDPRVRQALEAGRAS